MAGKERAEKVILILVAGTLDPAIGRAIVGGGIGLQWCQESPQDPYPVLSIFDVAIPLSGSKKLRFSVPLAR